MVPKFLRMETRLRPGVPGTRSAFMKTHHSRSVLLTLVSLACLLATAPGRLQAAEITVIAPGGTNRLLNPAGSTGWSYRLGTNEASTPIAAWRTNNFIEDATWTVGGLPLGNGTANDPNGYEATLVTTVPTATAGQYLSVFVRKTFVITNAAALAAVTVSGYADDGVVVWLNGRELGPRFQCCTGGTDPNVPTFNAAATTALESLPFSMTAANDFSGPLVEGTNVVCLQIFNANLTSSDMVLDAGLTVTIDDVPPTVVGQSPAAGATVIMLNAVQVNFSEGVTGVDAADLLINGNPATNVLSISPSIYTFEFTQPTTGLVSIAFAPTPGIVDLASNVFAGASWNYTLNANLSPTAFYISEFLAMNNGNGTNALRDENGIAQDWIEIRNPGAIAASIGGWYLTDNATNLTKWRIPASATVNGQGYFVIFASGLDRTNNLAYLHANFSLSGGGEYLALVDPNTNIVSQFAPTYPPQSVNVSYGRDFVDPSILGYFVVPTPKADNTAGFNPAFDVQFSRTGGTFAGSFLLTLTTADTNAQIRYNIITTAQDVGSATNIPTPTSTLYTGPITVNNSVQVRARAFPVTPTSFPGSPRTECYIQVATGITNFVSDLPIVIIHTINTATLSGGYPALDNSVMITCMDTDNPSGMASIMDPPQVVKRAGINLRGSSTQGFPKSSYAVEFLDEYNDDEEASFAGLPAESDWVLYAPNQFDLSLMHNRILHKFGSEFGYYSSRTRFVEVFFRNGTGAVDGNTNATGGSMLNYSGVYVLEEKVKRDGNRVDIDVLYAEQTNAPAITGGYLLKIDRTDGNERTFVGGGVTINYQEPDGLEMVTTPRLPQANYIKSIFDNFNTGLQGNALTNIASTNHYSNYLDIDGTIDLHIVNVLVMNADAYRLSGYITKPRSGKLIFGPLWDVDRGLGTKRGDERTFAPRSWQSYDASSCGGTDYGTDFFQGTTTPSWFGRLFADVDFWQRWIDRYQDWRQTKLATNYVTSVVDEFATEVRGAQVREQKRWTGGGASDTSPRNGTFNNCANTFSHTFPGTYQGEIDFQKRWLLEHIHFMDTNLLNRPGFASPGGLVPSGTVLTLVDNSGKAGTQIYYTLDGTDPRGFQGTTNPAALLYSGPITITNNVRINARAVNPNHRNLTGTHGTGSRNPVVNSIWSGNVADTYYTVTPPLVITELMYHPLATGTNDEENFEYVELQNIGTNTLNLVGFRFTNGIDFTFTTNSGLTTLGAGDRVLIVKNVQLFTNRYGPRTNIAGAYSGALDNGGERITFVGPRLEPILDFTYSDTWYPLTDGLGFSLVINDPNGVLSSWGSKTSWHNSSLENGSPGVVEPPALVVEPVYVNEALTHTDPPQVDAIELFNPGTNQVNIGGWYLTDNPGDPKKYQIPANTIAPPGGYILFYEIPHFGAYFSLDADGDDLYLFSATNGTLTGFAHGFDFGATSNGLTLGRYVNSQGNEDFVAQISNSLDDPNAGPLVGPVVISEIMYHPPDTVTGTNILDNSLDEYIEIQNLTTNVALLYDPVYTANTWRLSQAVTFNFPPNSSLAPTGFALVVNFNPNTNAAQLAAFRSKYAVDTNTPIYGPYGGQLDNSSDNIRLSRPDAPNVGGEVPYILVDRVEYADAGAWPAGADGIGLALHRLVPQDYGNDPTNWFAGGPTPGGTFVPGTPPEIVQHPANATVFVAGSVIESSAYLVGTTNFTAVISGINVVYQWRFNGNAIPGATNSTLTLTNIQFAQAGNYSLLAFNNGGAVITSNAVLTVISPVYFSAAPTNVSVLPGTNVTLTALAVGNGGITYQWRFEGVDIPGATNASHSFTNANLNQHHGNFSVVATDALSTITSTNAFVYVLVKPVVVQHVVGQTVPYGGNATFTCLATGAPPITYRWLRGGTQYLVSANPVLVLSNVTASTTIRVAATNLASASVFSPGGLTTVPLTVIACTDCDGDGMLDSWEVAYLGGTNASPTLDSDGDGMNNGDEFRSGTNPTNALSVLKMVFATTNAGSLTFVAQSNLSYSVQWRTNLIAPAWTNLTSILASPLVRTIAVDSAAAPAAGERYFRVVTPMTP